MEGGGGREGEGQRGAEGGRGEVVRQWSVLREPTHKDKHSQRGQYIYLGGSLDSLSLFLIPDLSHSLLMQSNEDNGKEGGKIC